MGEMFNHFNINFNGSKHFMQPIKYILKLKLLVYIGDVRWNTIAIYKPNL